MKTKFNLIFLTLVILSMNMALADEDVFKFSTRGYNLYESSTDVSFSGTSYRMVMRGDNKDDQMPGIGILDGSIDPKTRVELQRLVEKSPLDEGLWTSRTTVDRYVKNFFRDGQRQAKLDVLPRMEVDKSGGLLVSLEFRNSGKEDISFENPKKWGGTANRILSTSYAILFGEMQDKSDSSSTSFWTESFGGRQLVATKALDAPCVIPAGEARLMSFIVFPEKPIKKGSYLISASIAIKAIYSPELLKGSVDFASLDGSFELTHDYPSTPAEIKAFDTYLKSQEAP